MLTRDRLQGERQLEQRTLEHSSNNYDKHLLSRIGGPNGPNTPKRTSVSSVPASVQETAQLAHAESERWSGQLRPLSMPDQRQPSLDSPATSRWPSSGAVSPGFTGAFFEHGLNDHSRSQGTASRHASLTFEDSVSQRGSYDQAMFNQGAITEDSPMSHLLSHDRSSGFDQGARAGMKRRADSPPRELVREERTSVSSTSGPHEMYHRRSIQHLPPRDGPINRHHSSLSSASSHGPRHGSLGSSLGVASISSSATSYGSGRVSPSGLSPVFDPELRSSTPYSVAHPLNNPTHQRVSSDSRQGVQQEHATESVTNSRNGSVANSQGAHSCECCPKKPKRFDTIEELRCVPLKSTDGAIADNEIGYMNQRNSILVRIARIALRTRTKRSDIKTLFIFVAIVGVVPFFQVSKPPSTPPSLQVVPICAGTAAKSSLIHRSGTSVRSTSTKSTSLENVTKRRSFSAPTIFANILSIPIKVHPENGQTNWKLRA